MAKLLSVSQLTAIIRKKLEGAAELQPVSVTGEVSNLTYHRSGHVYFSLKDDDAQLSCVMFRAAYRRNAYQNWQEGEQINVTGHITVYAPRGSYQMSALKVEAAGAGQLYQRFLELKARLEAQGLFDPGRKRPLPDYPRRIIVITSPTGAVLHDIRNTLQRRYPCLELLLIPAQVQGESAAPSLLAAFELVDDLVETPEGQAEAVILARGGGSLEDLWCFNDEDLAHAIVNCPLPVISAVGHETDFTIADFAADLRAPTPTAAAELAAPSREQLLGELADWRRELDNLLVHRLSLRRQQVAELRTRLDYRLEALLTTQRHSLQVQRATLANGIQRQLAAQRHQLALWRQTLEQGNHQRILQRGYALVYQNGQRLYGLAPTAAGDQLALRMQDGEKTVRVEAGETTPASSE